MLSKLVGSLLKPSFSIMALLDYFIRLKIKINPFHIKISIAFSIPLILA